MTEYEDWTKSSFCESSGCVEAKAVPKDLPWAKSSFCESNGCVEIVPIPGDSRRLVSAPEFTRDEATGDWLLRSSLNPDVALRYTPEEWDVFVRGIRNGEFVRWS